MSSNFFLINEITYCDRRLTGVDPSPACCCFTSSAVWEPSGDVGVASLLFNEQPRWWLASLAGSDRNGLELRHQRHAGVAAAMIGPRPGH